MEYEIGESYTSHTGGLVTITKTGLIHQAGKGYGGVELDEDGEVATAATKQPEVKRGRGRPRKTDIRVNVTL